MKSRRNKITATVFLFLILTAESVIGQESFSLSDCIRMAAGKNSSVKQAQTSARMAELDLKAGSNTYIPSLAITNENNFSTCLYEQALIKWEDVQTKIPTGDN